MSALALFATLPLRLHPASAEIFKVTRSDARRCHVFAVAAA